VWLGAALVAAVASCSSPAAPNPVGLIGSLSQATPAQVKRGAANGAKSGVSVLRGASGVVEVITGGPGPSCTSRPVSAHRLASDSVLIVMSVVPTQACFFSFHQFEVPVSFAGLDARKPLRLTVVVSGVATASDVPLGQTPPYATLRWVLRPGQR
jgi:hypothetical protein